MTEGLTPPEKHNRELWDELAPVHFNAYREVEILRAGGVCLDEIELAGLRQDRQFSKDLHL
jgi:hypothetical protein